VNIDNLTIKKVHNGLVKKEFSAVELTESVFEKIKKRNKEIYAFLTLSEELALAQAKRIDKKIKNKEKIDILAGVPIAIKDNILVEGIKCTAGSKILENYIAPYDATVIKKLKKREAIIVGKTNMDEFAMGSSTENSAYGMSKNPHNIERVPGGSSGGSTSAVGDNQCVIALGSDTGGSIRQPASFCGVTGFKPTYGRVSRYGLMALASSLDQIGPIAKTIEDVKILFDAIDGYDENDATIISAHNAITTSKQIKIGIPKEYFIKGLDERVEKIVRKTISQYEEMGAEIVEMSLSHTDYALSCYYIILSAEASTNLARYDGIKYGLSKKSKNLLDGYLQTRQYGFGEEVKRRIMLGAFTLSAGYYDAYYLKAQKVRALIKQDFDKVFEKVDVLMCPTAPTTAFKIGEKTKDPVSMYLSDVFTVSVNLAGLPAVSVPCGKVDNLPVGLQIIGNQLDDEKVLEIAGRLD